MIKSVTFRNFEALADVTFEPSPLTVMLGQNGSGKTSILERIQHLDLCQMRNLSQRILHAWACLLLMSALSPAGDAVDEAVLPLVQRLCMDCHNTDHAEAGINLEVLTASDTFGSEFRTWQSVATQLEQKRMPPIEADQPALSQRKQLVSWIQERITARARAQDGDPGHVVIRRLTSAEYGYAIRDLTGIEVDVTHGFVSDAVGGAGFTNTGIVQFTQDSTLERYLEAARRVADHAVVGTGSLTFFRDPGRTGLELSAIDRIQRIYRTHGFRTAAGEGGKAFGLEKYQQAFLAAWRYQHRQSLGQRGATLESLAAEAGIGARFAEHIYGVLTQSKPSFPTSEIVEAWSVLPTPARAAQAEIEDAASKCEAIARLLRNWQNRFGTNTDAKEEAPVLRADLFDVNRIQPFEMNVNWPEGTQTAHLVMTIESANRDGTPDAVILWKNVKIQFRNDARRLEDPQPLRDSLTPSTTAQLKFGEHPREGEIEPGDFVTVGTKPVEFELPIPEGARSARLMLTAELDVEQGQDCIVRCTIAQLEETDQGKSVSGLLTSPDSAAYETWKNGVLEFARLLPQMSHREPAPSDRDPIPEPFDATYNNAERNFFHTRIKYFRDDQFLVENILDDQTRLQLDQAWADLLGAFEFHDTWLGFLAEKYRLNLDGRGIADLDDAWIVAAPPESQGYLKTLKSDFDTTRAMFRSAQSRHVEDVVQLAAAAWRRPLASSEVRNLHNFYRQMREDMQLDHRSAICGVIARVLVSPDFLYRAERATRESANDDRQTVALSQWELASRLSFFLWSSVPDEELQRAAAAGELKTPEQVAEQAQRMLRDPKSRRFVTEFFGQWFGFYRFNEFRGIDPGRFPEFSESLRQSMYDEAIEFFDDVVRNDRPVSEILFADDTFLNQELATHYGIDLEEASGFQRYRNAHRLHRGGLLRLGVVLATTSAPRRTSPVKRGDWILRRVLGTAVPPPPADAGSIPADDVVGDGFSIRQRLEAHRRDTSCHNCHARFDALGFALENYDPLGRWRERYRDEKRVETVGTLRDGTEIKGIDGLHAYLSNQKPLFHETLARKLLGYALGRRESVGDLSLIEKLTQEMDHGSGIPGLVEHIAMSRQFRYHRVGTRTAPVTKPIDQNNVQD